MMPTDGATFSTVMVAVFVPTAPAMSVTASVTVYVPGCRKR